MKVTFLLYRYPEVSHTFIDSQITGLIDLGYEVNVVSFSRTQQQEHPRCAACELINRITFLDLPGNILSRVLSMFPLMFRLLFAHPVMLLRSLNPFTHISNGLKFPLLLHLVDYLVYRQPADIVLCHFGPMGKTGVALKRIGAVKRVVTVFHGWGIRLAVQGETDFSSLFEHGDLFFSISDYNRNHLLQLGAPADKMVDHPVGIDLGLFSYRDRQIQTERPISILTVARLSSEKGLEYGIEAIGCLLKSHPGLDLQYLIVGDGECRGSLQSKADQLGLSEVVHLLGSRSHDQVLQQMQQADVFILPSLDEALPTVIMEAQACGLPVVASDVGGVRELIREGETGFLVPSGQARQMGEKIEHLIQNPETYSAIASMGRKQIEDRHDIDRLNLKLAELLKQLL